MHINIGILHKHKLIFCKLLLIAVFYYLKDFFDISLVLLFPCVILLVFSLWILLFYKVSYVLYHCYNSLLTGNYFIIFCLYHTYIMLQFFRFNPLKKGQIGFISTYLPSVCRKTYFRKSNIKICTNPRLPLTRELSRLTVTEGEIT